MNEQELIQKIKSLKQIAPDDGWIALTKSQILSQTQTAQANQEHVSALSILKFAFRPMALAPIALCFVIGLFAMSQISLPGETLHPVKKVVETAQETLVVKQENKSEFYLDLAGKRANELKQVVSAHQTKKLFPAIQEYEASLKKATESVVEATKVKNQKPEQAVALAKKVDELKQATKEIKDSGVEAGEKEIDELEQETMACLRQVRETTENKMATIAREEIQNLENSSLNDEQKKDLEEIKILYGNKDYSEALIKILLLSQ